MTEPITSVRRGPAIAAALALLVGAAVLTVRAAVVAADFKGTCYEEAVESVLCRAGDPTTVYGTALWLLPVVVAIVCLAVLSLVVVRPRRHPLRVVLTGAIVVLAALGVHEWLFNLG